MSRFNKVATLVHLSVTVRDDGSAAEDRVETDVFVNPYSVGAATWAAARSAGLHADAEVQLRSLDYTGQELLVMDGITYHVENVSDTGEFVRLTLERRVSHG